MILIIGILQERHHLKRKIHTEEIHQDLILELILNLNYIPVEEKVQEN